MKIMEALQLAREAATQAGLFLQKQRPHRQIESAQGRDIKLREDREAEELILNILNDSYPMLGEESGEHGDIKAGTKYWIVDPLDGTFNYARGLGLACVSIALWQDGVPLLGVINHFQDEMIYSAVPGQGAWLNDSQIQIGQVSDQSRAALATGFPVHDSFTPQRIQAMMQQMSKFNKVRMLGSAALSLALVACGKLDVYNEHNIMLWDVAAGLALVKAAGGDFRMLDGDRKYAYHITAANAELLSQL